MQSFYAQLYLDLQERIREFFPTIWIEQDFQQENFDRWRPPFDIGAGGILIDFPNTVYSAETGTSQFAEVTITFRLMFAAFSESYEDAPLEVRKDALHFFELEHKLAEALQGWATEYCQPLIRQLAESDNRYKNGLRIRTLTFSTAYEADFEE